MKLPKDQPFWTSVILHAVVLLGLFLATIVQAFKPKEKPHVFVMVEPPSDSVVSEPVAQPQPPLPVEVPPVDLPPVPDVEIPQPPTPQKVTPKPQPVAKPKPREPEQMSYEEFLKLNPQRQKPTSQPTKPREKVDVPRIDVPRLEIPKSQTPSNQNQQLTPSQVSALADFSARLRSKIDAAWTKPAQLAGVQLVAEVVFDVSPSGRISNVRLRSSSGNAAFDQSVIAAFGRVGSVGPTPTGQGHSFTLPFRMRD